MENKEALNRQLKDTIQSMMAEGLINNQFAFVNSLKVAGDSSHLADIITQFCIDTPNTLNELTEALNKLIVDYNFVKVNLYKVKGSALSLGARRVALAFCDFEQALHNKSKEE
ncbi:hypothetical protein L6164_006826 [Bauhinia variegata]|uniref:Uncharacterized protein n=1 Tax=Bauhinia variegata TaxID=167791 RepID=A0ACB9PUV4_BAUVA|nr:hypothetical protein L6164_006826 [Bauhinia variegata]